MHRIAQVKPMGSRRMFVVLMGSVFFAGWAGTTGGAQSSSGAAPSQAQIPVETQARGKDAQAGVPALPRGQKLVLKDGTFQLVRDYRRNRERVGYLSAEQVGSQVKTDKKQFLKKVLSPIPIVPSKRNVEILGNRASIRVTNGQAEFYLREAPPDPNRTTPIVKSSRPGESGPEVELVRATDKGK